MARIFSEGFENGSGASFTSAGGNGMQATTSTSRSGAYTGVLQSFIGGLNNGSAASRIFSTTYTELYFRFAAKNIANLSNNTNFWEARSGGGTIAALAINSNNGFNLKIGSTIVATSPINVYLSSSTYYIIEIYLKIAASPNGVMTLKIDGAQQATFTGATNTAGASVDRCFFQSQGQSGTDVYVDDIAINDTTGSRDNSWCGDGHIIVLKPNAAGTYTNNWRRTGTSPVSSNWDSVDDIPHDSDVTYISQTGTSVKESFNVSSPGLTNINVSRVWVEFVGKNDVADGSQAGMFIITNGGEASDPGGMRTMTTSYIRYYGTEWATNPITSGSWSLSDLENLEIGVTT